MAGQHPHEHAGVWAALGIADYVSSALPAAAIRPKLDVTVVPMINPDANVHGRNAWNAQGMNPYRADADERVPGRSRARTALRARGAR